MMTNLKLTAAAIAALLASATFVSNAQAYSSRVQNSCKNDYLSFCAAHPVGSTGARRCMESNGKSLSGTCINALVDAGEIPRKYKR
jgi:hypothetical protein